MNPKIVKQGLLEAQDCFYMQDSCGSVWIVAWMRLQQFLYDWERAEISSSL